MPAIQYQSTQGEFPLAEVSPTSPLPVTMTTVAGGGAVVYNATPPTIADGARTDLQGDVNANLKVVEQYAPVPEDNTNGYFNTTRKYTATITDKGTKTQNNSFTTVNVKNSGGTVVYLSVINTTASVRYIQLHNTTTTPAGGATAAEKWLIPANGSITLTADQLGANGASLATGIAIANSSVAATYTAGSAGDLLVDIRTI